MAPSNPSISCILTSYNQDKWLRQAIQSVLGQSYQDWELFVMDDNSSNPLTHKILKEFGDHPKVQVFVSDVKPEERMLLCRYSHLINLALERSQGNYITYLTDDDFYYIDRFKRMIITLQKLNVDVVYGYQTLQTGDDKPYGNRATPVGPLDDAYDIIDHNSIMHSRKVYDTVGGWTEDPAHWRGADGQYWRKITDAGFKFYSIHPPAITEVHRFHTRSIRSKLLDQNLKDLN